MIRAPACRDGEDGEVPAVCVFILICASRFCSSCVSLVLLQQPCTLLSSLETDKALCKWRSGDDEDEKEVANEGDARKIEKERKQRAKRG